MTIAVSDLVLEVWYIAAIGLGLLLSVLATGHVVLNKRDSRAAIAWVGFVWLVPLVGSVLYFIFGVNRIRHKAALLRRNLERYQAQTAQPECLSYIDPLAYVSPHEPQESARARLQGRRYHHDAIRHGGAERSRPLPSGRRRD